MESSIAKWHILFFYKSNPDKQSVDQFIDELFKSRDIYLREMYFAEVNKNLSYEAQKNDLQWLRRIEAISTVEFSNLKKELDEVFQNDNKKIGFN